MQAIYFLYAALCAWRDRAWLRAGGAAYAASLHAHAPPPSGTGPAAAAAPAGAGLGFPPFVGLGDAPVYYPFFADAATAAPCATCCACCVVRDPLLLQEQQLQQPVKGQPAGTGAAKPAPVAEAVDVELGASSSSTPAAARAQAVPV